LVLEVNYTTFQYVLQDTNDEQQQRIEPEELMMKAIVAGEADNSADTVRRGKAYLQCGFFPHLHVQQ